MLLTEREVFMNYGRMLIAIGIMALVTYLPRMLPLAIFKKKIKTLLSGLFWPMSLTQF